MIGYFSKHQSLRNLNMLKNINIGSFLVLLSNCDWQFETDWEDLTCRMLMKGILIRPNLERWISTRNICAKDRTSIRRER